MNELLKKERFNSAEQAFFESYYEYGEDNLITNYRTAIHAFYTFFKESDELSERIANGEIVEPNQIKSAVECLIFSERHASAFRKEIDGRNVLMPDIISSLFSADNLAELDSFEISVWKKINKKGAAN